MSCENCMHCLEVNKQYRCTRCDTNVKHSEHTPNSELEFTANFSSGFDSDRVRAYLCDECIPYFYEFLGLQDNNKSFDLIDSYGNNVSKEYDIYKGLLLKKLKDTKSLQKRSQI